MARLLRGYAAAALENQPLWHERDISHSSAERVLLPDATILLDYMLVKTRGLVERLVVRPERMRENIERGLGLHCSSRVLLALVEEAGMSREEAYAVVQRNSMRAADERRQLRDTARRRPGSRRPPLRRSARRLLRRKPLPAQRADRHRPTRRARPGSEGGRRCRPLRRRTPAIRAPPVTPSTPPASSGPGKVRDLFEVGDRLLLVASDRLSAFDVVLPTPIPDKGRVLTGLSRFWFEPDRRTSSRTTCSARARPTCRPASPTTPAGASCAAG